MKTYVVITGDTNDGDYITSRHEVTEKELELVKEVAQAIKDYMNDKTIKQQKWNWWAMESNRHNRPTPKQLYLDTKKVSKKAFDFFYDLTPSCESGIHSIDGIEVLIVAEEYKINIR